MRLLLIALLGLGLVSAQEPKVEMAHYVVVFLKRGPNWTSEVTEETKKLGAGHMANISRMAATGKLVLAGPFEDDTDVRGMFVFKCSMEEAQKEAAQDPAVKAGRLVLEFRPWFSARGIGIVPTK